ncbi:hypothetical protein D3C86_1410920 [compost metagenome]
MEPGVFRADLTGDGVLQLYGSKYGYTCITAEMESKYPCYIYYHCSIRMDRFPADPEYQWPVPAEY